MKTLIYSLVISLMFSAVNVMACTEDGTEGFVPENSMYIPADAESLVNANMDEASFNSIIDKAIAVYEPVITSKGAKLVVGRNWTDGTVNAYAMRSGSTWQVQMFGGLARHQTVTEDALTLVVCHELGHHIGGAPRKGFSWATNEGQADYFASLKCLRKIWLNDNNEEIVAKMNVPADMAANCQQEWAGANDQAICIRSSMAGLSTALLFRALRGETFDPKVSVPDPKKVASTDHNHPGTQCRLDTYHAGALCGVLDNEDVSDTDEAKGVCYAANGQNIGARPLCWFKPLK